MSFRDLERGGASGGAGQGAAGGRLSASASDNALVQLSAGGSDDEYKMLCDNIGRNVFQISNNVSAIQKMAELIGSPKDSPEIRQNMYGVAMI